MSEENSVVYDFTGIAEALRKIKEEEGTTASKVDAVSSEPYCDACDDNGWEHTWGPQGSGPFFTICAKCGNPNDYEKPDV